MTLTKSSARGRLDEGAVWERAFRKRGAPKFGSVDRSKGPPDAYDVWGNYGAETAAYGVRGLVPNWLPEVVEDANYEFSISLLPTPPEPPKMRKRDRNRAQALLLAGGPKPSLRERAVALAQERGVVRTGDLTDIGIPRCYLTRMCDEGLLVKVGYGLYRAAVGNAA